MTNRKRGRPQKHKWIELKDLDNDYSPEAQYLKWASVNNSALAHPGFYGCPKCSSKNIKLRHDEKFKNIRFYCPECGHETSFRIKNPPKHNLRIIPIHNDKGILIGEKTADNYHEKTTREIVDSAVLLAEQKLDLGGEWFDGVSGIHEQDRYLPLEEALDRIKRNYMKTMLEAKLKKIEYEEDRLGDEEAETSCDNGKN
jgi:predicted RNA-binding Zn-ribbon protein involved in translation (DUF1610 family)